MLNNLYHNGVEIKSVFLNGVKVFSTSEVPVEPENQIANITITGIAKVGETLTATVTDGNGLPSIVNYQWYADEEVISDATDETYVLKEAEAGKSITIKAQFTDNDGHVESVTSPVSDIVQPLPNNTIQPLSFTTTNDNSTDELGLIVRIVNPDGEWELRETDTKVADSNGFLESGITSRIVTTAYEKGAVELTLKGVGNEKHYELYGDINKVGVTAVSESEVSGSLVVENFSNSIVVHRMRLGNNELIVPNTLPPYITTLESMFTGSKNFNQDISGWDVSKITNMNYTFQGCTSFNQDIGKWDVSNVTHMASMFSGCSIFNQDISRWNVSNVTNMTSMLYDCASLKSDISKWCVSNITQTPVGFLGNNTPTTPFKSPVWGTCPRGEDSL